MPLRLAIVNDFEVVVRGLAEMLAPWADEIEVVELDSSVPVSTPVDIALLDTFARPEGSLPGVAELVANPAVGHVVVYTWAVDESLVRGCLKAGASAFLAKTLSGDQLAEALRAVAAGTQVVVPEPHEVDPLAPSWPGREHGLTAREAEVIALITRGRSNADIASGTGLSINSVKSYIRSGYRKIGVTSRTQAVLWGLEHGFHADRLRIAPAPAAPQTA